MGNPMRNIEVFSSILKTGNNVEQTAAAYGLALSYFEAEQYANSKDIMDELLSRSPENLFYLDLMTDIHIKQKQPQQAISMLFPLWQGKPQNSVLTLNLANAYISNENFSLAIDMLRDLLLVDKENFLAYQLLNDAYNLNQQKKDAHMAQAEIYALISAYPLAIDELQYAYNQSGTDSIEKLRIKGRISQLREAQASMMRLSL